MAIAEFGDRTQLLALVFAARYRKPWTVLAGVLCATLLSNVLAAVIGKYLGAYLTSSVLNALVGVSMIAMGLWALKPDSTPSEETAPGRHGAFVATCIAFSIAELGDKTQLATMALAAAYANLPMVVAGATAGMMLANAPAVLLGHAFARRLPLRLVHIIASVLFIGIGVLFLWRAAHHH